MTSPATASVPSEEDVARTIASFRKHIRPDSRLPDILPSEMAQASAVLALFAPILAEKERDSLRRETRALSQAQDWRNAAEKAEARALAALAGERERCLAIVEAQVPEWVKQRSGPYWDGYREAMEDAADDIRKGALAIRAQGE